MKTLKDIINEEQIDELSKDTLKNYIDKTSPSKGGFDGLSKKKWINRIVGRSTAKDKVEEETQIDELSKATLKSYMKKADKFVTKYGYNPKTASAEMADKVKRRETSQLKVIKKLAKEEIELDEARGRPKASGTVDGEAEANQNIIMQLRRAKESMQNGATVHFKDGKSHHVTSDQAARILDKHADMKPVAKAAFQTKIHQSHDNFKTEL